jgi:hypothetical protein
VGWRTLEKNSASPIDGLMAGRECVMLVLRHVRAGTVQILTSLSFGRNDGLDLHSVQNGDLIYNHL